MSAPSGSVTTGQTSSRSTLRVQPCGDLAGAERRGQRVGRRVAAAQAAQVDDVPAAGVRPCRRGESATASATAGRSAGAARIVA